MKGIGEKWREVSGVSEWREVESSEWRGVE